jgi:transposase-like protein
MASTESIRGLARELNVEQRLLYHWRDQFQAGGVEALRRVGRPSRRAAAVIDAAPESVDLTDPADAKKRIDELERKIGQQQLELDFFRAALRHVGDQRPRKGGSGGTTSTR